MNAWKILLAATLGVVIARQCLGAANDAAHLHRRPAAAGRDAQDRRRVPEAQSEREGGDRSRRRDVGSAAAISVDGAVGEGLGARRDPDRRHPSGAVGGARLGRAARRVSRRRQGEDPADVSQGVCGRQPGRRQADRAAVLRRRAVPLLPQGPARQVQAPGAEELGRDDGDREDHHGRREESAAAGLFDGRARRSKARCARTSSRCGAWAATSRRTASSTSTPPKRGSRSSCTGA